MSSRKKALIIRDPKYFKALTSAQRLELISSLSDDGPGTIADLAERLGRTPHSLYHHMKTLLDAGIVSAVRAGKKKKEAVFTLTSQKIMLGPDPKSSAALLATKRSLDSMLSTTCREVYEALLSSTAKKQGRDREIYAMRMKGRFPQDTLRSVNKLLDNIEKVVRKEKHNSGGKVYALTIVLTPCHLPSKRKK
jgi:DNA-binding transcriptional ArsR family regulator